MDQDRISRAIEGYERMKLENLANFAREILWHEQYGDPISTITITLVVNGDEREEKTFQAEVFIDLAFVELPPGMLRWWDGRFSPAVDELRSIKPRPN